LIDEQKLRLAGESRVEIELLQPDAFVVDLATGKDLQAFEERSGLDASVGLDDPNDHVDSFLPALAGGLQHGVGLSNARRRSEETLQPAAVGFRRLDALEQLIGIRTLVHTYENNTTRRRLPGGSRRPPRS